MPALIEARPDDTSPLNRVAGGGRTRRNLPPKDRVTDGLASALKWPKLHPEVLSNQPWFMPGINVRST